MMLFSYFSIAPETGLAAEKSGMALGGRGSLCSGAGHLDR
jgi:hypothetical protein